MKRERGGTFLGFVIGLVVGLGLALAVAVYVNKVPNPFMNKGQSRSAEQDDAEAKKNKDWDPNAPLYGKNPAKTAAPAAAVAPIAAVEAGKAAGTKTDAKADAKPEGKVDLKPAVNADPLGDLAKAKMALAEPFSYFVQVGAFRTLQDAEGHRAKLSLSGVETKISEREQSGAIVYRVRAGPFDRKDEAEKAKEKLDTAGFETALVRVQR